MEENPIKLSQTERLILANQYIILGKLFPENSSYFEELQEIVENGYEQQYPELNSTIQENFVATSISNEIMDILDMFRSLNFSYDILADKSDIDSEKLQFVGFDGNNETDHYNYACFLVLKQNRWEEVLEGRPDFDLNSHSRTLNIYRRMLTKWNSVAHKNTLTRDAIIEIIGARTFPEGAE